MPPNHKNVGAERHLKLLFAGQSPKHHTLLAVGNRKNFLKLVAPTFQQYRVANGHSNGPARRRPSSMFGESTACIGHGFQTHKARNSCTDKWISDCSILAAVSYAVPRRTAPRVAGPQRARRELHWGSVPQRIQGQSPKSPPSRGRCRRS